MTAKNSKRIAGILQSIKDCSKKCKGSPRYLELEMISGRMITFESIKKMRLIGQKLELWITGDSQAYSYGIDFIKGILWVS